MAREVNRRFDPWDEYPAQVMPTREFLPKEIRDRLIEEGQTVIVTGVRTVQTKYGERFFFDLDFELDGTDYFVTMPLAAADWRKPVAAFFQKYSPIEARLAYAGDSQAIIFVKP